MAKGFSGRVRVVSKRTARSILKGSSRILREDRRRPGSPRSRSLRPSKGSTISPVSASAATALIVKSLAPDLLANYLRTLLRDACSPWCTGRSCVVI